MNQNKFDKLVNAMDEIQQKVYPDSRMSSTVLVTIGEKIEIHSGRLCARELSDRYYQVWTWDETKPDEMVPGGINGAGYQLYARPVKKQVAAIIRTGREFKIEMR